MKINKSRLIFYITAFALGLLCVLLSCRIPASIRFDKSDALWPERSAIHFNADDAERSDCGITLPIYSVKSRKDKGYDKRLLSLFGMDDTQISHGSGYVEYSKDGRRLIIYGKGSFIYSDLRNADAPVSLTDDEIAAGAEDFLRSNGLMPDGFGFSEVCTAVYSDRTSGNESKRYENQRSALFYRELNGYPVIGKSHISVTYSGGEICRVESMYNDCKKDSKFNTISYDQAVKTVLERDNDVSLDYDTYIVAEPGAVNINEVSIVYYENAFDSEQTTLQPCYVFSGTVTGLAPDGQTAETGCNIIISALR